MNARHKLYIIMGIVLAVALAGTFIANRYHPTPPPAAARNGNGMKDYDTNPKPTFKSDGKRLTATMDLTYCWFATFTNQTTGKSHTLKNAYDKDGKHCR